MMATIKTSPSTTTTSSQSPKTGPVRIEKKLRQLNLSSIKVNQIFKGPSRGPGSDDGSTSTQDSSLDDNSKLFPDEIILTSKEPLKILEMLESSVNCGNYDSWLIREVCKYLKLNGKDLDQGQYRDPMNHYFNTMRNLCRETSLDPLARTKLLEIIELRARGWCSTEEQAKYFKAKSSQLEPSEVTPAKASSSPSTHHHESHATTITSNTIPCDLSMSNSSPALCANVSSSSSTPTLAANASAAATSLGNNEVIKHSGKFQGPVKVPGKNFLKDEFVIRNSDSGKVNPGAKDRLLQITGPDEGSINRAKYYIEDTIKRNASPIPFEQPTQLNQPSQLTTMSSPNINQLLLTVPSNSNILRSSSTIDASTNKVSKNKIPSGVSASNLPYVQAVSVGDELLIVSSSTSNLAIEAKNVLEAHFKSKRITSKGIQKAPSREPSESSDSEASIHRYDGMRKSLNNICQKSDSNKSTVNGTKDNRNSIPPSNTSQTDLSISSSRYKSPANNGSNDIQRSASHGSLSSGRTSLRFINKEFEVDIDLIEAKPAPKDASSCQKIVYDREFLLKCADSEMSKIMPPGIEALIKELFIKRKKNPDEFEWPY